MATNRSERPGARTRHKHGTLSKMVPGPSQLFHASQLKHLQARTNEAQNTADLHDILKRAELFRKMVDRGLQRLRSTLTSAEERNALHPSEELVKQADELIAKCNANLCLYTNSMDKYREVLDPSADDRGRSKRRGASGQGHKPKGNRHP